MVTDYRLGIEGNRHGSTHFLLSLCAGTGRLDFGRDKYSEGESPDCRTEVVLVSWWLPGGITADQCAAAYQSIGAPSLAASYVNLNNPGAKDAIPGVAPAFDASIGWTFDGSSQYLNTGIIPTASTWSMFIRFSGFTGNFGTLTGQSLSSRRFFINQTNLAVFYGNGGALSVTPNLAIGILGFAGNTAYRDGVNDGTIPGGSLIGLPIFIGALDEGGGPSNYANTSVQAACYYNATLTPSQVTALITAMAALPDSFRGHASISDQERQVSSIGYRRVHRVYAGDILHTNAQLGASKSHSVSTFDHHGGVS